MNIKGILIATGVTLLFFGAYAVFYKREQSEPGEDGGDALDFAFTGTIPRQSSFKLSEFDCHDGTPVPAEYYGNVQVLMDSLQVLRDALGVPITVISGFRTKDHNAKVGGAKKSFHLTAMAADIKALGVSPDKVREKIKELIASGKMLQGGIGNYATFTHYDVRGYAARWNG